MWPRSIISMNILITIGLFLVPGLQVHASPGMIHLDSNDKHEINFFSDLEIKHDEVYAVDFEDEFQLSGIGTGLVSKTNKINAMHQLDNGNFILSTHSQITVNSEKYETMSDSGQ